MCLPSVILHTHKDDSDDLAAGSSDPEIVNGTLRRGPPLAGIRSAYLAQSGYAQKKLAGNAFHVAAIGSVLLFALGSVEIVWSV